MTRTVGPWLTLLLLAGLVAPLQARAATEGGVDFADAASLGAVEADGALELCATGLLRVGLLKGYAAALYRESCDAGREPLDDAGKRLELAYFWSIDGDRFGEAAEKILRRNLEAEDYAALEDRLARLHASYESVEPGDRYALTYVPGRGTALSLNGRTLTTVEGGDFARAYFGIWLGEQPIDEGLRDDLLAPAER